MVERIGLDIGGTFIKVAVRKNNDKNFQLQKNRYINCRTVAEEIEINILEPVYKILKGQKPNTVIFGICLGGSLDKGIGKIISWPNRPRWNGFPLKKYLEKRLLNRVYFEDDANAAALGEAHFGIAKDLKDFIYVTLGTGIGSGIILNNQLYQGANGKAGELGHVCIHRKGKRCSCGNIACLQSYINGKILFPMAKIKQNKYLYSKVYQILGNSLYNTVMLLDVPYVVIGGGVISIYPELLKKLEEFINKKLALHNRYIKILRSELGDFSGVCGMQYIIREEGDYNKNSNN